jgi:hypothetical protein
MATKIQPATASTDTPAATDSRRNRLFALTVFLSAFLLFQVQPLIGKAILPWYGGGPAVWSITVLFFQAVLFAGYLYAFLAVRYLPPRPLAIVHTMLLAAAAVTLPINPPPSWQPTGSDEPALHALGVLAFSVGLPYFLLASTAPLVQVWFSRTNAVGSPYRLYALSNAGSLLALLSYPILVEPVFGLKSQGWGWSAGFVTFAVCCAAGGWWAARAGRETAAAAISATTAGVVTWSQRLRWLLLPACASVLLLATTNYICQDVASLPLLWIAPLSLYLVTFILCFDSDRWYRRSWWMGAMALSFAGIYWNWDHGSNSLLVAQVGVHLFLLFACGMVCHGELVRLRPPPAQLTSFYLSISAGGAIGGIFVGLIAPHLFYEFSELPLAILACGLLAMWCVYADNASPFYRGQKFWAWAAAVFLLANLGIAFWSFAGKSRAGALYRARNFYGALAVMERHPFEPRNHVILMRNGRINHGAQFQDEVRRREPHHYHDPASGVGQLLSSLPGTNRRIGVTGLGIGTLAAYGKPGDYYRFYEINPLATAAAHEYFSYLKDSAAKCDVIDGDARLSLEQELAAGKPQNFDVLVLDAFSGDAVPMHLLTKEACAAYLEHLKPNGLLAINVTNLHLDLIPVTQALANEFGLEMRVVAAFDNAAEGRLATCWVLLARDRTFFDRHPVTSEFDYEAQPKKPPILWTDDFSNIWQVLL